MPRDGTGVYSLPKPPFVANTKISSDDVNSDFSDISAALTQSLSKDGQTPVTGNLNLNSNRITNSADAVSNGDLTPLSQVKTLINTNKSIFYCGTTTTSSSSPYIWNVTNSEITSLYDGLTIQIKLDQVANDPTYLKINNLESVEVRMLNGNNTLFQIIKSLSTNAIYTVVLNISAAGNKTWQFDSSFCAGGKTLRMAPFALFSDSYVNIGSVSGTISAFGGIMNVNSVSTNITGIQTSGMTDGTKVTLYFSASGTLVHSSAFQLPLSQNLTVQSGDWIVFRYFANAWRWENYSRADGKSIGLTNVQNVDQTNANNLTSGAVARARLGSGTADVTTFLRGDGTWALPIKTDGSVGSLVFASLVSGWPASTWYAYPGMTVSGSLLKPCFLTGGEPGIAYSDGAYVGQVQPTLTGTWAALGPLYTGCANLFYRIA